MMTFVYLLQIWPWWWPVWSKHVAQHNKLVSRVLPFIFFLTLFHEFPRWLSKAQEHGVSKVVTSCCVLNRIPTHSFFPYFLYLLHFFHYFFLSLSLCFCFFNNSLPTFFRNSLSVPAHYIITSGELQSMLATLSHQLICSVFPESCESYSALP